MSEITLAVGGSERRVGGRSWRIVVGTRWRWIARAIVGIIGYLIVHWGGIDSSGAACG